MIYEFGNTETLSESTEPQTFITGNILLFPLSLLVKCIAVMFKYFVDLNCNSGNGEW